MKRAMLAATLITAAWATFIATAGGKGAAPADVLDRPSMQSTVAPKRLLMAVTRAGDRLVAVGPRGHIVFSTNAGLDWTQAIVPVSSDLTAVYFPSPQHGWAVGHDGVVLATVDSGATWTKQLDGRQVNALILADVKAKLAARPEATELPALVAEAERNVEHGPDKPFLDVWFENETTGYVVGAYNLLLATTDGGKTWQSWFDRTQNPRFMNLYAIRPAHGSLYIAGEGGTVLRLDRDAQRFVDASLEYTGSMFGIADGSDAVIVFGLRGNAFRSSDGGAHWTKVETQLPASIVSSTMLGQSTIALFDQGGRLSVSSDGGAKFTSVPRQRTAPLTSVADAGGGRLAMTGPFGVTVVTTEAPR